MKFYLILLLINESIVIFVYSLYRKALRSNSSISFSVRSLTILAGTPATSLPVGTTKPSLTSAPAATNDFCSTTAPSRIIAPIHIRHKSFIVQPCNETE